MIMESVTDAAESRRVATVRGEISGARHLCPMRHKWERTFQTVPNNCLLNFNWKALNGNLPGRFHSTKAIAKQASAQTSRNINNFPFYFRSDVSVVEHTKLAHLIYSTIQFSFPLKSPQPYVNFKDSRIKLIHTSKQKKQFRVLLSHAMDKKGLNALESIEREQRNEIN